MKKEITLQIRDEHRRTVQSYSSALPLAQKLPPNVPEFWFAPPSVLSGAAGLHRFVWNLQWTHPATLPYGYYGRALDYTEYTVPDHAISGQTPRYQPPGPYVVPGTYEIVLTVDGKAYRQSLVVKIDPRVPASQSDLQSQLDLARQITDGMESSYISYYEIASLRLALGERQKSLAGMSVAKEALAAATALEKELSEIQEGTDAAPGLGPINRDLGRYLIMIESADARPAASARENAFVACESLKKGLMKWRVVNSDRLPALNKLLETNNLKALATVVAPADPLCVQ